MQLEKVEVICCLVPLKDNQIQTVNNQSSSQDDTIVFPLSLKRGCLTRAVIHYSSYYQDNFISVDYTIKERQSVLLRGL